MKAKDIIKNYYKDYKLEVLDNGKVYQEFDTNHYCAVSLDYISKHLFKDGLTKKYLARIILELCNDEFLLPIPCTYANDLVFVKRDYADTRIFMKYSYSKTEVINTYYSNYDRYVNKFNNHLK